MGLVTHICQLLAFISLRNACCCYDFIIFLSTQHAPRNTQHITSRGNVRKVVRVLGMNEMTVKQMMELTGLKDRKNFLEKSICLQAGGRNYIIKCIKPRRRTHERAEDNISSQKLCTPCQSEVTSYKCAPHA